MTHIDTCDCYDDIDSSSSIGKPLLLVIIGSIVIVCDIVTNYNWLLKLLFIDLMWRRR